MPTTKQMQASIIDAGINCNGGWSWSTVLTDAKEVMSMNKEDLLELYNNGSYGKTCQQDPEEMIAEIEDNLRSSSYPDDKKD